MEPYSSLAVSSSAWPEPMESVYQALYHSQQGDWAVNYAHDPLGRLCREHQPDPRAASAWEGLVPRQSRPRYLPTRWMMWRRAASVTMHWPRSVRVATIWSTQPCRRVWRGRRDPSS